MGSSELAQHGFAVFAVFTRPQREERREIYLLILFAAKELGASLLLPLIVVLSRPVLVTGDFFFPRILVWKHKQEMGLSDVEWFFLFS